MANNAVEKVEQELKPAPRRQMSGSSRSAWRLVKKLQSVIGLIAIIIAAIVLSPRARDGSLVFTEIGNLTDILRQVSEIGIIALAMTFVILTGGIDLSVGSILAISASVTAMMLTRVGGSMGYLPHIVIAVGVALLVSAGLGLINGAVIAKLRIQPFIVTLASMIGVRGLARWLTSNTNIDFSFSGDVTATFADAMSQKSVVIGSFVGLSFVLAFLLKRTVFGRYVRAIGDNEKAATYAGIPIARTTILVYLICGLCSGFAGVLHAAQCHQGNPNDGVAYELEAIAAVVIGGTSLAGGQGTIVGTIIGTLIMGILTNILRLKMVDSNVELMIKAVIIVLAVWAQSRKRVV
jgi:ribose transport system permease protein